MQYAVFLVQIWSKRLNACERLFSRMTDFNGEYIEGLAVVGGTGCYSLPLGRNLLLFTEVVHLFTMRMLSVSKNVRK